MTPIGVPAYERQVFHPRRTRHAVLVPVLDEGERIRSQLLRMRAFMEAADVIVVDGGSRDGSTDPEALRAAGIRALLIKTGPGRLSAQLRVGLAFALQEGYEGAILIDGNNKDDPAAIPAFVQRLEAGFDHVQGSRFVAGGVRRNNPWWRVAAIRWLHAPLISLAAGFRYTDTTNGFRAYSRRFLEDPYVAPFRDVFSGYELHYYLAIRAARLGYRVVEIPVERAYPAHGPMPTKISIWRGSLLLMTTLLLACVGWFDPCER